MKILKLYVYNSGVFNKPTAINFANKDGNPQNILCLSGVNGSGKTTVMELIFNLVAFLKPNISANEIFYDRLKPNILPRTEFAQLDLLVCEKQIVSIVLGDDKHIQYTDDYQQICIVLQDAKEKIKKFEDAIGKVSENTNIEVKQLGNPSECINAFLKEIAENIDLNVSNEKLKKLSFVYFLGANDREIQDIRYDEIPKVNFKYKVSHRYIPSAKHDELKKLLVYYDYAYSDIFKKIKTWLNEHVLEGKFLDKIYRPEFKPIIKIEKSDKAHGLELLSSGEQNLVIIAINLYLKASKNAILLIDEIDQSLHPEFQAKIMRIIVALQKETGCQIIVSSHSRFIWNALSEEAIIDLTQMVL